MIQIEKPIEIIIKASGTQKITKDAYRHLHYLQECKTEDGILLYNLLTRELLLLSDCEYSDFQNINLKNPIVNYLIKNWFLVPLSFDEYLFLQQINNIAKVIYENDSKHFIKGFTIFPTTDCNARCFYCFENGCKKIDMSEQTARDVVDFILKKSDGTNVHISWFGGEPLYNSKVIDIIVQGLKDNGINPHSSMVSNAYLFNKELVDKAKKFWNLEKIQITLDGTENIYNKVKAYIYKDEISPFQRVINNIKLLLEADVAVRVRLNLDFHNYDDLEVLINDLAKQYSKYEKFSIYISLLYENAGKNKFVRSDEKKILLWNRYDQLCALISSYGMPAYNTLKIYRRFTHCMADSKFTTMILPDGSLGKCENYVDDNFYGSIYSDNVDQFYIDKFKEVCDCGEQCRSCALQPKCLGLKVCPNHAKTCDEFDKKNKIKHFKEQILASHRYYIKNKKNEELSEDTEFCE